MSHLNDLFRRWSYRRQCLGRRAAGLDRALRAVVGVYSAHPSAPLALYARVKTFELRAFYRLDQNKKAFRVPAMRLSVFLMPGAWAYKALAATVPPPSDPVWVKRYSQKNRYIDPELYPEWRRTVLQMTQKPLPAAQIKRDGPIPEPLTKIVLNRMAFEGALLRLGAESPRSNILRYVNAEAWAAPFVKEIDRERALAWLAGAYLSAFGPIRTKDFQWWAGVSAARARAALALHETVTLGENYLLPACHLRDFGASPLIGNGLDLLPQWDPYLMGYAPDGRARLVDPDMQSRLYGKLGATGGNALGGVMVNGEVLGAWQSRFKGSNMHVSLDLFQPPGPHLRRGIAARFQEMADLFQAKRLVFDPDLA